MNVHIGYDPYDRPTSMTDGSGSHSRSYDDSDNVLTSSTTYTGIAQKDITYTYYPDSATNTMSVAGSSYSYIYDGNGRLTSMSSPAGTAGWSYLDNDWVNTQTLPNGSYSEHQYNALGLLTRLTNKKQNATVLSDYTSFTYDGVFNETGLSASVPGTPSQSGSSSFSYDSKDRLTADISTRNGGYSFSFGYDNAFNPTTFKGTTQSFNNNNQQTGTGFAWDNNGNSTTYKGTTCTYDPENRLTAYGTMLTAGYRADGLRAWSQTATGRTYYLYDGELPVAEMNSSGTITAHNIFGADGLVSRTGGTNLYYVFDQQGNVVQRLDSSQNVTSSSTYDAYGAETNSCSPADSFSYNGRWGYYLDRETSFQYCRHRYYDPATGRFPTRDPSRFWGGINLYGYCRSGPTGYCDPSGLGPSDSYWEMIWGLPNAIIGGVLNLGGHVAGYDSDSGSTIVEGGWFSNATGNAVTVGDLIGVPDGGAGEHTMNHERGHRDQSDCLGWIYLPATIAGYGIGALRGDVHDGSPLEMDADARSGDPYNIEHNPWVKAWVSPDESPHGGGWGPSGGLSGGSSAPGPIPTEKWPPKRELWTR